ncbi:class I SAM-dependent methyltransferase [Streptomyces sp. TR06-5]|uniref:class I SAM-dependent methyltransferase n=1 Tax=unclassified Streptomyces TaxID=2593676 RepID=UPI0039A1D974
MTAPHTPPHAEGPFSRHAGHAHGHGGVHEGHEPDWDAMADHLVREAELLSPFLEQAAGWLAGLLQDGAGEPGAAVRRLLDVGSGPGVATCVLARTFPGAEAVAVDASAPLLERAGARAAELGLADRVTTRQAELPDGVAALGAADLIWSSQAVHHLGDQQAALRDLGRLLRPGGVLAVVERGLPQRFLPRDIGIGRPGLQARLDAAHEDVFAQMRAELPGHVAVVEDWPALLAAAGVTPAGTRTFLTEHPAPLHAAARAHLHSHLTRLRDRLGESLDAEDRATLELLVDRDADEGILRRPDAFLLNATTVHAGRIPG